MEKGIIETIDNFLDSLGTTGRVTIELAGALPVIGDSHNAQTDYISQLQFQQGINANIGETIKDAFKSGHLMEQILYCQLQQLEYQDINKEIN